ncbi:MAG: HAD family hydrolase, partial [Lentisphaeria bacterium]|nr:HAD family hydrolase [Lentisphaeria bacterium]
MNLQEQHFLIDIDNTVTRYRKEASASGATLFGNCFLPVVRDLMIRRGWEREAAEKALFESVNNVLRWDYSELLRRFSIPWEEASGLMMLRHEEMLDVYQDAVELIRRLKAAGAHLCIVSNNPY